MLNRDGSSPYVRRYNLEMKNQPFHCVFLLFSENLRQPLKGDAQDVSLGRIKTKFFNQGSRAYMQGFFINYTLLLDKLNDRTGSGSLNRKRTSFTNSAQIYQKSFCIF